MLTYAVVEIAGKQYNVFPNLGFQVHYLGDTKVFECNKVLMKAEDGKIDVGTPYLKEGLIFDVLGIEKTKIRVATYKAKANTRRVKGSTRILSVIRLQTQTREKKG